MIIIKQEKIDRHYIEKTADQINSGGKPADVIYVVRKQQDRDGGNQRNGHFFSGMKHCQTGNKCYQKQEKKVLKAVPGEIIIGKSKPIVN